MALDLIGFQGLGVKFQQLITKGKVHTYNEQQKQSNDQNGLKHVDLRYLLTNHVVPENEIDWKPRKIFTRLL